MSAIRSFEPIGPTRASAADHGVRPTEQQSLAACIGSIAFLVFAGVLLAQPVPNALVLEARFPWSVVRDNLLKMAEKMPAEYYSFKPSPEIETFGQRVAHIAGANLRICEGIKGNQSAPRRPSVESKAEFVAALKESSAACDSVFDSLTDAAALEKISSRLGGPFPPDPMRTKLSTLYNMVRHSNEMYGYMCVYLRLKGIVPPSSAPE
jgi:DinB superfamily